MTNRAASLTAVIIAAGLAAVPVRADPAETDCLPAPGNVGCAYVPANAPPDATLLIYLRGFHPKYKGNVPDSECLASSRQAFIHYGLGSLADEKGLGVLVTCRSNQAVTEAVISAFSKSAGRPFAKRILAAHSGGYVGLGGTLDAGVAASRILMLDDFYDGNPAGLARKLQLAVSAGASCAGYFTPHNKKRYEAAYKPNVACAVDELTD
ncbi:MAG: hypothetical protein KGJ84_14125, partial [Elusimicrobia bacterium]|nr:hypothetical protein [Elusimicrobiota bacterium]